MKEKIELIKQGFYKEMPNTLDSKKSILSDINKVVDKEIEKSICEYLNNGIPIIICFDLNYDIISNNNTVSGNSSLLTDGVNIWPADLSYYVQKYNLELDKQFIDFMKQKNWKIETTFNDLKLQRIYVDNKRII